jgi:hypothetical protein
LKLAVRKFIKYDLPTGTQIGLISVSTNDVKILSNLTSLQTLTLRRALADKLPNYPNVDSGGNISLRRGIFQAVEVSNIIFKYCLTKAYILFNYKVWFLRYKTEIFIGKLVHVLW